MANDYISRDYAVENMENFPWDTEHDKNAAIHLVRELVPAADVRPVVRGEFVGKEKVTMCYTRECSNCHGQTPTSGTFCSVCGADMREEAKDA